MSAITFLNAVEATGASSIKALPFLVTSHTVQATITGAPTAVTVDLEGSLDGTTFFALASHVFSAGELTAEGAMFHVVDKPVTYVRINLTTLTAGTEPTVTVKYDGDSLPAAIRGTGRRGQF
jgi:hypothetical protein